MNTTRRDFMKGVAAAAVACGAARVGIAAEPAPGIIDSHQHVWDLKKLRLPWLDKAGEPLNRDYGPADYAKAVEGLNVEKAVYVEVAVVPEQRLGEAEYVAALCERGEGKTAAAVIGGSPGSEGFREYITRFKGSRYVKGVRESYRRGSHEDKKFLEGLRLLGELGMSFDLLCGGASLADAAEVAKRCPDTRLVLDHCGNPGPGLFGRSQEDPSAGGRREEWRKGIRLLAGRKNVFCKISGVAEGLAVKDAKAQDLAPVVNHCLDAFGPDRVVFGGNWPVCLKAITLTRWVELLKEITAARGEGFDRKLFHDNAVKVYGPFGEPRGG